MASVFRAKIFLYLLYLVLQNIPSFLFLDQTRQKWLMFRNCNIIYLHICSFQMPYDKLLNHTNDDKNIWCNNWGLAHLKHLANSRQFTLFVISGAEALSHPEKHQRFQVHYMAFSSGMNTSYCAYVESSILALYCAIHFMHYIRTDKDTHTHTLGYLGSRTMVTACRYRMMDVFLYRINKEIIDT